MDAPRIDRVVALTAGTAAADVAVDFNAFLLRNASPSATVYFRAKDRDGVSCTAQNGFPVGPGETLPVPLTGETLSVLASADGTDVRLLILEA